MLRISPHTKGERLTTTNLFRIEPAGSEFNVAANLSSLGEQVAFMSKISNTQAFKEIILSYMRKYNIDTSYISFSNKRIGIFWTDIGVGPRPYTVIYDRDFTSFLDYSLDDIDIKKLKKQAKWFHTSGITPSLCRRIAHFTENLLEKINKTVSVSIDLNHRNKLWKWVNSKSEIKDVMMNICRYAELLIGNETDFHNSFDLDFPPQQRLEIDDYFKMVKFIFSLFPNLKYIALGCRKQFSASDMLWRGFFFYRKRKNKVEGVDSMSIRIDNVIDRIGVGDAFTAGIIYGLLSFPSQFDLIINFATTLSALKYTVKGDIAGFSKEEVMRVYNTKFSALIDR